MIGCSRHSSRYPSVKQDIVEFPARDAGAGVEFVMDLGTLQKPSGAGQRRAEHEQLDVVIVGAGFAGLAALHRFRDERGHSTRLIEAADGPGGVWYWNAYPGARCDVESLQYALSFSDELSQEWNWTERFALQGEIRAYIDHVVERFDMAKDMRFGTRVTSAHWDEGSARWLVETDRGDHYEVRYLVMATGPLSTPYVPSWPGQDEFEGEIHHTGRWPHQPVNFSGKRVAVIGTGSSGVQAATEIGKTAAHLYVMQRTAHHVVPAANRPMHEGEQEAVKAQYAHLRLSWLMTPAGMSWRTLPSDEFVVSGEESALEVTDEERDAAFERAWNYGGTAFHRAFNDLLTDERASALANDFLERKIATIVDDPETARLLTPRQYYGTKRLILDSGYYEMFNRPEVELVDVKADPIEGFTARGVRTANAEYDVDIIVCATGYDALTGSLDRIDIRGRNGVSLKEEWAGGPCSYLGVMVKDFPNLFMVAGPQSPSTLANVIVCNEYQVGWIADCIRYLDTHGLRSIDVDAEAQEQWVEHVNRLGEASIYTKGANWYWGANVEGKSPTFLCYIGFGDYVERCEAIATDGYPGFMLEREGQAMLDEGTR